MTLLPHLPIERDGGNIDPMISTSRHVALSEEPSDLQLRDKSARFVTRGSLNA